MPPEIKEAAEEQTLRGISPVPKTCQNGHQHLKFYPSVPEMPLFGHEVSGIEDVAVDEALRHTQSGGYVADLQRRPTGIRRRAW